MSRTSRLIAAAAVLVAVSTLHSTAQAAALNPCPPQGLTYCSSFCDESLCSEDCKTFDYCFFGGECPNGFEVHCQP